MEKMINVSMDGPNVNWRMLSDLKVKKEKEYPSAPGLVEFGSCALHTVHNALKAGHSAANWSIFAYLRTTYYLFSGFPSRKGQFTRITGSDIFLKKFCTTRWIQNGCASLRAQEILPKIQMYISDVDKLPSSKAFGKTKEMIKDPLLSAKLAFFHGIASHLERFLMKFLKRMLFPQPFPIQFMNIIDHGSYHIIHGSTGFLVGVINLHENLSIFFSIKYVYFFIT